MDESTLDKAIARYRLPLGMGVVGAVLLIGGMLSSGVASQTLVKSTPIVVSPTSQASRAAVAGIKVDVSGAVRQPGVYSLPAGARVEDALKAAGGVNPDADEAFLSKSINLAQKISDGMKVYIPSQSEHTFTGDSQGADSQTLASVSQININNASVKELDSLPGVGEVTALSIIDKRPYASVEELLLKKAVNRSVYEKIKELVAVF